jgi:hypothetical protein
MTRFVLILLLATSAAAQITVEVAPRAGFAREGFGLSVNGASISDVTAVTFAGILAEGPPIQLGNSLFMGAPQHEPGDVEVRVTFRDGQIATTRFRYTTIEEWDRLLVPVAIDGAVPGAFGSQWTTETYVSAIDEAIDLRADWCTFRHSIACPPVFSLRTDADTTTKLSTRHPHGGVGAFVFVLRDARSSLAMQSWLRDLSRQSEAFGTEQPVVSVSEFRTKIALSQIPNDERFRVLLRVYGASARSTTARLRIRALSRSMTPIDRVIDIAGNSSANSPEQWQFTPAFAQLPLDSLPELKGLGPLHIEITSDEPLWAFASITNNTTQHVTLATPQP